MPSYFPFHPDSGNQTSNSMWESAEGAITPCTRQKAGSAGGICAPGAVIFSPAATAVAAVIVVWGSFNCARLSQAVPAQIAVAAKVKTEAKRICIFECIIPQSYRTLEIMAKQYPAQPPLTIDSDKKYTVTFETSKGSIVCDLFAKEAPKTVNNFVFLSRDKFYDGTKF